MDYYPLGRTVGVAATFTDEFGSAYAPPGAQVYFTYKVSGIVTEAGPFAMTLDGSVWKYQWDSRPADPGEVTWYAESTGGLPVSNKQGTFKLVASTANPYV